MFFVVKFPALDHINFLFNREWFMISIVTELSPTDRSRADECQVSEMDTSKRVTVARYSLAAEAQLMKNLLEEEGIQAFLADDVLIAMDWLLSNAVGGVKLQVLESDAERATTFIEENSLETLAKSKPVNESDVDVKCEACGQMSTFSAESRGGVEVCPHCSEYIDVPE